MPLEGDTPIWTRAGLLSDSVTPLRIAPPVSLSHVLESCSWLQWVQDNDDRRGVLLHLQGKGKGIIRKERAVPSEYGLGRLHWMLCA